MPPKKWTEMGFEIMDVKNRQGTGKSSIWQIVYKHQIVGLLCESNRGYYMTATGGVLMDRQWSSSYVDGRGEALQRFANYLQNNPTDHEIITECRAVLLAIKRSILKHPGLFAIPIAAEQRLHKALEYSLIHVSCPVFNVNPPSHEPDEVLAR